MAAALAVDLEAVLTAELDRAMAVLRQQEEAPYYVSLAVRQVESIDISAMEGALRSSTASTRRYLDVDLRTGTPELDSTHTLRGLSSLDDEDRDARLVPFAGPGEELALRYAITKELDEQHRAASERIVLVRGEEAVRVEEEDPAPDFEPRQGQVARTEAPAVNVDVAGWEQALRELSARALRWPEIVESDVRLGVERTTWTQVDTEGARLVHGLVHARVGLRVLAVADDGDRVELYEAVDVHDPARLPDATALARSLDALAARAVALRAAPRAGPYTGPVLLSGRASGVFFHEVMGHRVEGHRQKSDEEGKTFLEYVGKPVLPPWVDVVDDPRVERFGDVDLNGYYLWDDQGVAAAATVLVDDGLFRGFLMGRSPLATAPSSNGHGRRSPGHAATARMGNTMVEVRGGQPEAKLRELLRKEAAAQGLTFAYLVEEIDGGFTMTGRVTPNAFNVRASVTWRVFVDGRPDELVRGIDLVGTPLAAFQGILAAGDTPEVFNGVCGAESGWVPVSAVAPMMLFRRLEMQLKEKDSERPPLLSPPGAPAGTARLDASTQGGGR